MQNHILYLLAQVPTLGGDESLSLFAVFSAGLLAFLSPCVLPIIPLYMGYLSGTRPGDEPGEDAAPELIREFNAKKRRNTLLNTLFFVLGISFAYLTLGLAATSLGGFLKENGELISKIGGVLIIVLGLLQLYNQFRGSTMTSERRINFDLSKYSMNPIVAFVLGFTFSFAWTPCVGPILVSVITMVANASTQAKGLGLMLVYTLGFTLPFILLGLFTESILGFIKKNRQVMKFTTILGALLMIVIGVLLLMGKLM